MFRVLWASVKKEWLLLSRDLHALLVLFVMPLAFVLVMSLALQDQINGEFSVSLDGRLHDMQTSNLSREFIQQLQTNNHIDFVYEEDTASTLFDLTIHEGFDAALEDEFLGEAVVSLRFDGRLALREQMLILSAVKEAFSLMNVYQMAEAFDFDDHYIQSEMLKTGAVVVVESHSAEETPINSTQQSVPAWLVFAMFFVSLPISTVVIAERKQKSLMRLRTLGLSPSLWLAAKLLPYFAINIVQLVFMLLVGCFIVPLFGGVALSLNVSLVALAAIVLAVSGAALAYAAFIACVSKTVEQATILAGTSNILFGALGGVMVPSFVMPEFMRWVTMVSPMGWGLEGFITVLVHGGGLAELSSTILVLLGFACVMLVLALGQLNKKIMWEG